MKFSICIATDRINQRLINTLESLKDIRGIYEICLSVEGVDPTPEQIIQLTNYAHKIQWWNDTGNVAKAKNRAIAMGDGDWKILLDADDFLLPSILQHFEGIFKAGIISEEILYVPDFMIIKAPLASCPPKSVIGDFKMFFIDYGMKTGAFGRPVFFSKAISEKSPYDEEYKMMEERGLVIKTNRDGEIQILEFPCYIYNVNQDGMTKGTDVRTTEEGRYYRQKAIDSIAQKALQFKVKYYESNIDYDDVDAEAISKFIEMEVSCLKNTQS